MSLRGASRWIWLRFNRAKVAVSSSFPSLKFKLLDLYCLSKEKMICRNVNKHNTVQEEMGHQITQPDEKKMYQYVAFIILGAWENVNLLLLALKSRSNKTVPLMFVCLFVGSSGSAGTCWISWTTGS